MPSYLSACISKRRRGDAYEGQKRLGAARCAATDNDVVNDSVRVIPFGTMVTMVGGIHLFCR